MSPVPVLHVEKKPPNHDQGHPLLISCGSTSVSHFSLLFPGAKEKEIVKEKEWGKRNA
jgi:hypothetical protein